MADLKGGDRKVSSDKGKAINSAFTDEDFSEAPECEMKDTGTKLKR